MARIIEKAPEQEKQQEYIQTCNKCKTKFAYTKDDTITTIVHREEATVIICPNFKCGAYLKPLYVSA
jgi:NAD-dependent DNA ligase